MVAREVDSLTASAEHRTAVPQPREVHAALAQQCDQRSRTAKLERRSCRRSCRSGGHAPRQLLPLLRQELVLDARKTVD
jgi:hypothetical protein|tara:strand:+ start:110 stop:346 length:237 start_codon:yes stop_codon:yes gene_type:complete